MEASANTPALFEVIKNYDAIKVDDYQRTYAWTKDELDDLFDDLLQTVAAQDYHFFGTLILQAKDNSLATLVDGQQRVTTVFILVAALRDAIVNLGIDHIPANGPGRLPIRVIDKAWDFLYVDHDVNKHRFKSNRFTQRLLEDCVIAEPSTQQRIPDRQETITLPFRKAVKHVRAMVAKELNAIETSEAKLIRINELLDCIFNRFLVLRVTSQNLSESLEIFLTLNNRGLALGASDLVRGEVMGHLSFGLNEHEQQRVFRTVFQDWGEIAQNVREPEVFLRHYLVATGRAKVQKKKVHDVVSERIYDTSPEIRKQNTEAFWIDLLEASETYNQIISPKMGQSCQFHLEMLHLLSKSHRIFALNVLRSGLSDSDRNELVRLTFVVAFRWAMTGGNAQNLEDFFQIQGANLREGSDLDSIKKSFAERIESTLGFDVEKYLREEGDSSELIKVILYTINRAIAPKANQIPLNEELHLEHVAPQSATDGWKHSIFSGNESMFDEYTQVISEAGNLTLLDFKINLEVKQWPFNLNLSKPEKIKVSKYHNSSMAMTRDLETLPNWDEAEVQSRTKWVAESFNLIWRVDENTTGVQPYSIWRAN